MEDDLEIMMGWKTWDERGRTGWARALVVVLNLLSFWCLVLFGPNLGLAC